MIEYLLYLSARNAAHGARNMANEAQSAASRAQGIATGAVSAADSLAQRIGAIELAVETLTRIGIKQAIFTEEEFLALAREIDAEDGVLDGKRDVARMRKICETCGKPNAGTRSLCMWCGGDISCTELQAVRL